MTTRRRTRTAVALVATAVAVLAGAVGLTDRADPPAAAPAPVVATAPVTLGAMVDQTDVRGTLAHPDAGPVVAGRAGVLTSLPAVGTTIGPGQTLYTVDTRPVVLLLGSLPAWRTLAAGIPDGEDVRQLEQGLSALGRFPQAPDTRFTAATAAAVRSWQRSLGLEPTGAVERSAIVFAPQPLRVDALSSRVGADVGAGTELFTTSGTDTVVSADLGLDDQQLAVAGAAVTVVLPDGTELPATVGAVGETVERPGPDEDSGEVVVPVTVTVADQAGAARFSRADVTVRFSSTLGEDLLTVPVEALVAIDPSSFGVEVPDPARPGRTTVLPVTVGAFASGRVAVTGEGIVAGLRVVVAGP